MDVLMYACIRVLVCSCITLLLYQGRRSALVAVATKSLAARWGPCFPQGRCGFGLKNCGGLSRHVDGAPPQFAGVCVLPYCLDGRRPDPWFLTAR